MGRMVGTGGCQQGWARQQGKQKGSSPPSCQECAILTHPGLPAPSPPRSQPTQPCRAEAIDAAAAGPPLSFEQAQAEWQSLLAGMKARRRAAQVRARGGTWGSGGGRSRVLVPVGIHTKRLLGWDPLAPPLARPHPLLPASRPAPLPLPAAAASAGAAAQLGTQEQRRGAGGGRRAEDPGAAPRPRLLAIFVWLVGTTCSAGVPPASSPCA